MRTVWTGKKEAREGGGREEGGGRGRGEGEGGGGGGRGRGEGEGVVNTHTCIKSGRHCTPLP